MLLALSQKEANQLHPLEDSGAGGILEVVEKEHIGLVVKVEHCARMSKFVAEVGANYQS